MSHESITLRGYHTGSLETPKTIRNGFAFDLRSLDLRDRAVVSAALQLRRGVELRANSTVQLSDRSNQCAYGRFMGSPRPSGGIRIPLTPDAIADLQQASGGFFTVDAICEGGNGQPQPLSISAAQPVVALLVAEAVDSVAAA